MNFGLKKTSVLTNMSKDTNEQLVLKIAAMAAGLLHYDEIPGTPDAVNYEDQVLKGLAEVVARIVGPGQLMAWVCDFCLPHYELTAVAWSDQFLEESCRKYVTARDAVLFQILDEIKERKAREKGNSEE